jgi:hypothetical protein
LENKDASEKFDMVAIIIFIFYKEWVRWHHEWRMGIGEWRNWLYHQKVPLQIKIDISVLFILYQLGTNISLNSFYEICSEKNIANYDSITESLSRLERFDLIRCNSGKINIYLAHDGFGIQWENGWGGSGGLRRIFLDFSRI